LNDYQVFLHLLSKIGGVDQKGKYLQPHELNREYTLTAKEFSDIFDTDLGNSYRLLRESCEKLQASTIFLNQGGLPEVWKINICSMAKYNEGEGYISIKFTDDIMPYVSQVQNRIIPSIADAKQVKGGFVLYNLNEITVFGSLYATRLYELLQEYKQTGWVQKSVEQLRHVFAVEGLLKDYNDFKKRTFAHACDEINKHYPSLSLKFEEIKEGRKIGAVKFSFRRTEVQQIIDPITGKVSNSYIKPQKAIRPRKRGDGGVLPLFELLENMPILSNPLSNKG
jgi:plasmid replication initiation protein